MFAAVPFVQAPLSPLVLQGRFHPWPEPQTVQTVISEEFADLARIYEDGVNLCLIERPSLAAECKAFSEAALAAGLRLEFSQNVNPQQFDFASLWPQAAHLAGYAAWVEDVRLLVSAFGELFERSQVGLRLRVLQQAMCPRFHVDRVAVRLICSYGGLGTQWLPESALDRRNLGGKPQQGSVVTDPEAIHHMPSYAVALMKGENWQGNEGNGLVHRSPEPTAEQPARLILTIDLI